MYKLTDNQDIVVNLETGATIPKGHRFWVEYEEWLAGGNTPRAVDGPTFESVVLTITDAIQSWLDTTARQNGYDSAVSCSSYAVSGVPRFKADALAIIAWRDAVWEAANAWRNSMNGQLPNPVPSIEAVLAQLPKPATYGWQVHNNGAGNETPPPLEEV